MWLLKLMNVPVPHSVHDPSVVLFPQVKRCPAPQVSVSWGEHELFVWLLKLINVPLPHSMHDPSVVLFPQVKR